MPVAVASCPSWELTDQRLRTLAGEYGFELTYRKVETPEIAAELQFRGSPSVPIDGQDGFADGDEPVELSCRIYQTPAGSPTLTQLRAVLDSR